MSNNIEGKVVVITGASSGLGEASARYLSTQGATVVLGARRHDRIESLARELTARGGTATAVTTNVTDRQQVKKLVDAAVQAYGRIDVIGFVTLPNRTRSNSAGTSGSRRGDDFVPCLHRRGPKGSVRSCRCKMTLDVEGVVDCCMH
jgi:hypothetical protein